ncbi:MAG: histidine phosphatase family protein [Gaiellaceae bacterium]
MAVQVVYETHSTTVDNEIGRATGWLDGRLSERGRIQAAELGERRRNDSVSAVYTSDLGRAVETAEIAFAATDIPIIRDQRLRECNYGNMNGRPRAELEVEGPQGMDERYPNGESWREAVGRVGEFLDELARTRDGERVVVIGHMSAWYALESIDKRAPLDEVFRVPMDWQEGWEYELQSPSRQ